MSDEQACGGREREQPGRRLQPPSFVTAQEPIVQR